MTANGYAISIRGDENILKLMVVIFAQLCDFIKSFE